MKSKPAAADEQEDRPPTTTRSRNKNLSRASFRRCLYVAMATALFMVNLSRSIELSAPTSVEKDPLKDNRTKPLLYYRFWDHKTQRLKVDTSSSSVDRRHNIIPTSLEILESVLIDLETRGVEATNECFVANADATRALADQVVQGDMILSKPVFNVGMPKCGSTTALKFFNCAGWNASHSQDGKRVREMFKNGDENAIRNWLSRNGTEAHMQMDNNYGTCFYPQIQLLDEIHREYPDATFLLNFRPVQDWVASAQNWKGLATERWGGCRIPGLQCTGESQGELTCLPENLHRWWCGHVQHVRQFVKWYPSHKLVELDLYNGDESSALMSKLFAANSSCWGHANANDKTNVAKERKKNQTLVVHL